MMFGLLQKLQTFVIEAHMIFHCKLDNISLYVRVLASFQTLKGVFFNAYIMICSKWGIDLFEELQTNHT